MFDEKLIGVRSESNDDENLKDMLKLFKVPAGLNEHEREAIKSYFEGKPLKEGYFRRLKFWKRKEKFDHLEGMMNDHSRVFYLMGPDNSFAFYSLELDENELANAIIEDISYNFGTKYIGSGKKPPRNLTHNL